MIRLPRLLLAALLLSWLSAANAGLLKVQLGGLTALGPKVVVALDFVDGDGESNTLQLSAPGGDGTAVLVAASGDVSGTLASGLRFADSAFFNEALVRLEGADTFSFLLQASATAPAAGGFADAFSLFLLDPLTLLPVVDTTDPLGAGALFRLDLDGSAEGALQVFQAVPPSAAGWDVTVLSTAGVPEPATHVLVVTVLLMMALHRRRLLRATTILLLGLVLIVSAHAEDLGGSVQITRGGLALNRLSNTFDATVTVRNISAVPLLGPLKLALTSATPANVALYNSHGRLPSGAAYIELPLADGTLAPGASVTGIVRLIADAQSVTATQFALDGQRLLPGQTAELTVQGVYAAGYAGTQEVPVGAGFRVRVNGVFRGVTDFGGRLRVVVPAGAVDVLLQNAPNEGGSERLPNVVAGSSALAKVTVDDGKEIAADSRLRLDAVRQGILARNANRIALRFMDAREQAVRLAVLYDVQLVDAVGNMTSLGSLFALQADGSVAAVPTAFYQALAGKTGRLRLELSGEDEAGAVHRGSTEFLLADYRVRVQLVAPPSNPTLPLGGVRLSATILNTDLVLNAQSDATGMVVLPDLPRGNLSLTSRVSANGITYQGLGTVALGFDSLVKLRLRAPADILANVTPISVEPLPGGLGAVSPAAVPAIDPARARMSARSPLAAVPAPAAAGAASVSVSVAAAAQNAVIENSASLAVPRKTKKLTLRYIVRTAEYPTYVQQQSVYNDVWSLSVSSAAGGLLFEQTRQVNAQLSQDPVWLADGSTGEIKKEIDVAALTADADTNVILRATSVNIGDSALTTVVGATLDTTEPLLITNVDATSGEIATHNNGSYYSVPRPGAVNTYTRSFTVDLTKPAGATLTAASVDLLDGSGAALMTVLQDTAPGAAGVQVLQQDDTSAKLKVRVTVAAPASSVASTPPPARDLGYRVRVKATDSAGDALSDERSVSGKRGLWRMPDGRARYGTRDTGGDDWAARGAYNWIVTNGALLEAIDDVSGEHGRDIGHATHARGTDIDMFHFYRFPGAVSGTDNHNRLTADVIAAFGTLQPSPPPAAVAAQARVAAWLTATRQGLANLAALNSVAQLIHCRGVATQGLAAGWCMGLIQNGTVARTVATPTGTTTQSLNFGGGFANAKMAWQNDHNNHVHITLSPAQIGE